jgi:methylmalonyl-CoA mutase cobalamin-binding domain/chain
MAGKEPLSLKATGEAGVAQIKALLGLGDLITNVNVENQGQVANLPLHAVVETQASFSRDEVRPITAGALPPGVHSMVVRHVSNQEMIVEAALQEDVDVVGLSLLSGAHMTLFPRVRSLLDEGDRRDVLLIGGGIIPQDDAARLERMGVARLFGPGAPTSEIVAFITQRWSTSHRA